MTVIHIVLFKFLPATTAFQKSTFVTVLKTLSHLPSVKDQRFILGGPSISEPIEVSQGFDFALVSFHQDRKALEEYQGCDEHVRFKENYLTPIKENVVRFDFEVKEEDERLTQFMPLLGGVGIGGKIMEDYGLYKK